MVEGKREQSACKAGLRLMNKNELEILYEDDAILVCKKPAKIATQTKRFGQVDMESLIKNYRAKKGEAPFVGVVHRLDQPVEGVMVFGKTKAATAELSRQVRERTIGKHYYALSMGNPQTPGAFKQTGDVSHAATVGAASENLKPGQVGTLTDYIAFDARTNVSRIVPEDRAKAEDAKKAVLDYRVAEVYEDGKILFDITLHTGRHHQIRLQFANAGFPLIGDVKYGPTIEGEKKEQQLGLCSYKIEFTHPITKQEMTFALDRNAVSFLKK